MGSESNAPANLTLNFVEDGTLQATWDAVAKATSYRLSVLDNEGNPLSQVSIEHQPNTATTAIISNIPAETDYHVEVRVNGGDADSARCRGINVFPNGE